MPLCRKEEEKVDHRLPLGLDNRGGALLLCGALDEAGTMTRCLCRQEASLHPNE